MSIYNQLYEILSEALYGADAVLTTAQDFALAQTCTLLSYVVVLAPVLIGLGIFLKCVKW